MLETADVTPVLLCRIGSGVGAIPLKSVREICRPLPVEPFSAMPAFVLGLSIIRGAPTPVVDANSLLGSGALPASRFVCIRLGERSVALAVSEVLGVRELPDSLLAEIPPLLRSADTACVTAIGTLDSELLLALETSRLLPPAWDEAA